MVNIESEYKYKINKIPNINFEKIYEITQSYFESNELTNKILKDIFSKEINDEVFKEINTFRIRKVIINKKTLYILTLKTKGLCKRLEFEKEIPFNIYKKLLVYTNKTIIKNRYVKDIDGYTFEFDEYLNIIMDLITVEIETDINDTNTKKIENILNDLNIDYENITTEQKYKNKYLITK